MTKKCKVVMLPTGKDKRVNHILKVNSEWTSKYPSSRVMPKDEELYFGKKDSNIGMDATTICTNNLQYWNGYLVPQHLYFISNEEIKEGDWVYHYLNNELYQLFGIYKLYPVKLEFIKKIVATTDPSLGLPAIQQSFLKKYVTAQGKIDEVELEMEEHPMNRATFAKNNYILKLTKDNEVIVSEFSYIEDGKRVYDHGLSKEQAKEKLQELIDEVIVVEKEKVLHPSSSMIHQVWVDKPDTPKEPHYISSIMSGLNADGSDKYPSDLEIAASELYQSDIGQEAFKAGAQYQKEQDELKISSLEGIVKTLNIRLTGKHEIPGCKQLTTYDRDGY